VAFRFTILDSRFTIGGSGGGTVTTESAEDFVQIRGDGHLVVEEILEPKIIVSMGQGDQG